MYLPLQIIFNQHCESCYTEGSTTLYNLGKDYVLPLTLTGIAAYMVYWAFVKETQRDRKISLAKKTEENIDKLVFFSAFVRSALTASIQQKDAVKERIRQIRADDVNFRLTHFIPLLDLKRIPEVLNLEDYLLSYTKHYNQDRRTSVREFQNMLGSIDLLYSVLLQMKDEVRPQAARDFELRKDLQRTYQDAHNLVARLANNRNLIAPEFLHDFLMIGEALRINHPGDNSNIKFYNDYFFEPYNNFCINYLVSGLRMPNEITDLALLTRDGKQMYQQLRQYDNEIKETLILDFKLIVRTILTLRSDSRRLLNEF